MKKLTLLFLSMVLFLGVGKAFAEEGEGGETTPSVTLPTPTFKPANNSAVAPGTIVTVALPMDIKYVPKYTYMSVVVVYAENNDTVSLTPDMMTLLTAVQQDMGIGTTAEAEPQERLWKTASYDVDETKMWWSNVVVRATEGTSKLRMRLVTITYKNELEFSEEFTATYTIDPDAVQRPVAPTFSLQDGKLYLRNEYVMTEAELTAKAEGMMEEMMAEKKAELMEGGMEEEAAEKAAEAYAGPYAEAYMEELKMQMDMIKIAYAVNGTDETFDTITDVDKYGDAVDKKILLEYNPEEGIAYEAGQTIKAVTVGVTVVAQSAKIDLSDVVTYPVAAPTFNPTKKAVVAQGAKIEIQGGNPSKNLVSYYVIDGEDADFNLTYEQLQGQNNLTKYSEDNMPEAKPDVILKAANALINPDLQAVVWSPIAEPEYTVVARPKNAPTITPPAGMVAQGSKVEISVFPELDTYSIYYVIGGTDADFNLTYAQLQGQNNLTKYNEETGVAVTATGAMTIKAAAVNIDEVNQVVAWTRIVTVEYTAVARPVAPSFNPDGGEITKNQQITLTNGTENDETPLKIYYTIKGNATAFNKSSVSSLNSSLSGNFQSLWEYTGPLTITKDTTIHAATAKIVGSAVVWSEPVTRRFTIAGSTPVVPETPVAPVFDPDGGEIEATAGITITSACSSCKIYYTNGTTASFTSIDKKDALDEELNASYASFFEYGDNAKPALSDFGVETPGAKLSLTAAAASIDASGNIKWSETTTKEFTVKAGNEPVAAVATPTITPANDPGTIRVGQNVTIECTTNGAKIYYTTDKSAPFNADNDGNPVSVKDGALEYTGPFPVTESMMKMQENVATPNGIVMVRAIAVKDGKISEAVRGSWEVVPNAPKFSVVSGKVKAGAKVGISVVPSQAKIYYTTDGSTPTEAADKLYTDSIEITGPMTLRAFAVLGQRESSSATATYTLKTEDDANLTFDPASGAEVEEGTAVTITADKDVRIFYLMYASEDAATSAAWNQEEATFYSDATKPVLSKEKNTIKAAYIRKGEDAINNDFAYATYTVKDKTPVVEEKDTLPMPKFNPVGGEVEKGTTVVLSCDTANVKIYYSINADTVTVNSLEYTTAISIDSNMTIKAIAVKDGFVDSKVAEAAYTVKKEETANEGLELQGVSIYPNPSDGNFNIELPVAATVEVFATNGALVRSFTATAGKATLNLDRSGIYFVRIMGEGRSTVKRVIVR